MCALPRAWANSVLARPAPAARGGHADASRWSVTVSGLSAVASRVAMVGLRPDGHATCRSSRSSISISSGLETVDWSVELERGGEVSHVRARDAIRSRVDPLRYIQCK